jgi:hypothetical protein
MCDEADFVRTSLEKKIYCFKVLEREAGMGFK